MIYHKLKKLLLMDVNCQCQLLLLELVKILIEGNADFSSMEELDGDNGLRDHSGRTASRDIV